MKQFKYNLSTILCLTMLCLFGFGCALTINDSSSDSSDCEGCEELLQAEKAALRQLVGTKFELL